MKRPVSVCGSSAHTVDKFVQSRSASGLLMQRPSEKKMKVAPERYGRKGEAATVISDVLEKDAQKES